MQELVTLIEQRNAIINCLDEDRQRWRGWGQGSRGFLGNEAFTANHPSSPVLSLCGLRVWRGLRDYLALPPVGHSASLSHFREEEEDKMLEAMIKKKGEALRGALTRLNSCRVRGPVEYRVGRGTHRDSVCKPFFCQEGHV